MSSSTASSGTPGEETHYATEEIYPSYARSPSGASSTATTNPNESSESVYVTANQTPTASPDMNRDTASWTAIAARYQGSLEGPQGVEESSEELGERASSTVMASPGGTSFTHRAEASTYLKRQRVLIMQQVKVREPEVDIIKGGFPVSMPDRDDNTPAEAQDKSSHLWPPHSAPRVNDSRPSSLADVCQSSNTDRREASDISYRYRPRPTSIDVDSKQKAFLSKPVPTNNNTSSLGSTCTTHTHQRLAPIEEEEMPYDASGKFNLNPNAVDFVPRQVPREGDQQVMMPRNLHDSADYGRPQPMRGQAPAPPVNTPNIARPPSLVRLFGGCHGMFYDPSTKMFIGDGPPRKSPYRPDGTLPSTLDGQSDFITNKQYPQPAEDMLHIQTEREVTKRMANFGKNGPIQTIRAGGPVPQGNQQWTRVMMEKVGEQSEPLGRRMPTADGTEKERSVPRRPVYLTNAMMAHHLTLMGHVTGEVETEEGETEGGEKEGYQG